MAKILDQTFLDQLEQGDKKPKLEEQMRVMWRQMSHSSAPIRLLITLVVITVLLISQTAVPGILGIRTLLGMYQEQALSLSQTQSSIHEGNQELAKLETDLNAIASQKLPETLQKLKEESHNIVFAENVSQVYRLLEEIVPRNVIVRTVVFTTLQFESATQAILVEGQINSQNLTILDGNLTGSGYSLLSYFVMNANRSPYFQKSVIVSITQSTTQPDQLIFKLHLFLQSSETADADDNNTTFLEYAQDKLENKKIKR